MWAFCFPVLYLYQVALRNIVPSCAVISYLKFKLPRPFKNKDLLCNSLCE